MRQITEKDFKRIKSLEKKFYAGSEKFNNDLQDCMDYERPFMEIMRILNGTKEVKE